MIWDGDGSQQKEKYSLKCLESDLCFCCYTGDECKRGQLIKGMHLVSKEPGN